MLRYRVAYDSERGHFVLPTLTAIVPSHETFASRSAAQTIAQARNSHVPLSEGASGPGATDTSLLQEAAPRRASA